MTVLVLSIKFRAMIVRLHILVRQADLLTPDGMNIKKRFKKKIIETTSPCIIPRLAIRLIGTLENVFLFVAIENRDWFLKVGLLS